MYWFFEGHFSIGHFSNAIVCCMFYCFPKCCAGENPTFSIWRHKTGRQQTPNPFNDTTTQEGFWCKPLSYTTVIVGYQIKSTTTKLLKSLVIYPPFWWRILSRTPAGAHCISHSITYSVTFLGWFEYKLELNGCFSFFFFLQRSTHIFGVEAADMQFDIYAKISIKCFHPNFIFDRVENRI